MSPKYQRVAANQEAKRTLENFAPLIGKYARKFYSRASKLDVGMEEEDIRQELSFIFLKCRAAYDENKGGSFMNFLISAWFNEMNGLMRKEQYAVDNGHFKLSAESSIDEEGSSLFDLIDSGCPTPEDLVTLESSMTYALDRLSDQARLMVEILLDPPEEIVRQFRLQRAGAKFRRDDGVRTRSSRNLNLNFLENLFDLSQRARARLQGEIKNVFLCEAI